MKKFDCLLSICHSHLKVSGQDAVKKEVIGGNIHRLDIIKKKILWIIYIQNIVRIYFTDKDTCFHCWLPMFMILDFKCYFSWTEVKLILPMLFEIFVA